MYNTLLHELNRVPHKDNGDMASRFSGGKSATGVACGWTSGLMLAAEPGVGARGRGNTKDDDGDSAKPADHSECTSSQERRFSHDATGTRSWPPPKPAASSRKASDSARESVVEKRLAMDPGVGARGRRNGEPPRSGESGGSVCAAGDTDRRMDVGGSGNASTGRDPSGVGAGGREGMLALSGAGEAVRGEVLGLKHMRDRYAGEASRESCSKEKEETPGGAGVLGLDRKVPTDGD